jgi:hypothetical protein
MLGNEHDDIFKSAGDEWNVDPLILKAMATQESGGNTRAVSKAGAQGLMQIMPSTQKELGIEDPNDPVQSIYGAAKYMNQALAAEKTPEEALLYYHGGPGWRDSYGPESQGYVPGVLSHYKQLTKAQPQQAQPQQAQPQQAQPQQAQPQQPAGDTVTNASYSAPSHADAGPQDAFTQALNAKPSASAPSDASDPFSKALAGSTPAASPDVPPPSMPTETPTLAGAIPTEAPATAQEAQIYPSGEMLKSGSSGVSNDYLPDMPHRQPEPQPPSMQPPAPGFTPSETASAPAPPAPISPIRGVNSAIQPIGNIANAAVAGAKAGFGDTPLGMSPSSNATMANIGVYNKPGEHNPLKALNQALISPLVTAGELTARGAAAIMKGLQGTVAQTGAEAGMPLLGRDLAAIPEAFPMGPRAATGIPSSIGNVAEAAPANPLMREVSQATHDNMAAPLSSEFRDSPGVTAPQTIKGAGQAEANPLTTVAPAEAPLQATVAAPVNPAAGAKLTEKEAYDAERHAEFQDAVAREKSRAGGAGDAASTPPATPPPPSADIVSHPSAMSSPQATAIQKSAGAAATPVSEAEMSTPQALAARATAERVKLREAQQPGIADTNAYIPGVTANAAEREQTVNTARELKALNQAVPEASQDAKNDAFANNEKRREFIAEDAGSKTTQQTLKDTRKTQFEQDTAATMASAGGKAADISPVYKAISDLLDKPTNRQNTPLKQYVQPLLDRLQDPSTGKPLITDPEELIGFRQDVNRMLSKTSQMETPGIANVSGELRGTIIPAIDKAIGDVAPAYAKQRSNYADYSRQIDEQKAIQSIEDGSQDSANKIQYGRFQGQMKQAIDAREAGGYNEFKAISDAKMQRLWSLRDDLRRAASAQELARAAGSDTAQNAMSIGQYVTGGAKMAAKGIAHAALFSHFGPAANVIANTALTAIGARSAAKTAAAATARDLARSQELLRPSAPLRNPLQSD